MIREPSPGHSEKDKDDDTRLMYFDLKDFG